MNRIIKTQLNLLNLKANFNTIFKRNVGIGQKVSVNGINIHYERVGNGKHNLLLLPGALGSTRTDFEPQLEGLNKDAFTLIAWDPPGYGFSRPPDRDFNDFYRKDAKLAAQLMKTLSLEKYSVLGWSDGGITGLILSAAYPENVLKLVIFGANSYVTDKDRQLITAIKDTNKWSPRAKEAFVKVYGEELFARMWPSFIDSYVQFDDICKQDLKSIVCPTFILHGDLDPLVAEEHPQYLVNNIKNAKLYRFPKGKHNIHQKYSKEFNKLVEEFLIN